MPLTSSAVAGKKAAPKAPARRRQAAVAQAATAATTLEVPNSTTSDAAPPSPPLTQDGLNPQPQATPLLPDTDLPTLTGPSNGEATRSDQAGEVEPDDASPVQEKAYPFPESNSTLHVPQPVSQTVTDRVPEPTREVVPERILETPQPAPAPEPQPELHVPRDTHEAQTATEPVTLQESDQTPGDGTREQIGQDERTASERQTAQASQSQLQDQQAVASHSKKRQHKTPADAESTQSVKRVKKTSVRSNITVQSNNNAELEDGSRPEATPYVAESSRIQQQPQTGPKATRKPRKLAATSKRKKRSPESVAPADDDMNAEPHETSLEEVEQGTVRKKRRKRRKPSQDAGADADQVPDEDAELHEIDPGTLSMFALSHDNLHGKTSEREKKMAAINWDEVTRKRREEASRIAAGQQSAANGDAASSGENANAVTDDRAEGQPSQSGEPQFTIDTAGNIVVDESSLQINRQEAVEEAERRGDPVEDVNDLTMRINRSTWVNNNRRDPTDRVPMWKSKSDPWSEDETDKFYEALRMWGTDFGIISKLFPGKTRKHVKLKFTREERLDPDRLNSALLGKKTKPMNLEEYARETGNDVSLYTKYDGVAHALSLINASMKEQQTALTAAAAEEARLEKERVEREKQKALEKKQATKKPRKKRGTGGGFLGGAPTEGEA